MNDHYEKIEDYLEGQLNKADQQNFESSLKQDEELRHTVEQHREMTAQLDAMRIRQKVKSALAEQHTDAAPMRPTMYSNVWAIAAALTALAAAIWFFMPEKQIPDAGIAQQQPLPEPPTSTTTPPANESSNPSNTPVEHDRREQLIALARTNYELPSGTFIRDISSGGAPESTLTQAANAFDRRQYNKVLQLIGTNQEADKDDTARFLRAGARFQMGQYATAKEDYEKLADSFQFKHEARWSLILCYVALDQTAEAKKMLKAMQADPDAPFRTKAIALLKKI
ncbi:MAG: hypothetical protein IT269_05690 [Saprospiraceae bacterium]|nr:hypothetical protein [Saprospiraceae bacterium]